MREGNEDVMWYVATRKDSGAHFLLNENYIEKYENEFERIREFDTMDDAKLAYDARENADVKMVKKEKKRIHVSKVRGDIRKGTLEDEEIRARMKAEIEEEISLKTPSEEAKVAKPKRASRPTKEKLE